MRSIDNHQLKRTGEQAGEEGDNPDPDAGGEEDGEEADLLPAHRIALHIAGGIDIKKDAEDDLGDGRDLGEQYEDDEEGVARD